MFGTSYHLTLAARYSDRQKGWSQDTASYSGNLGLLAHGYRDGDWAGFHDGYQAGLESCDWGPAHAQSRHHFHAFKATGSQV